MAVFGSMADPYHSDVVLSYDEGKAVFGSMADPYHSLKEVYHGRETLFLGPWRTPITAQVRYPYSKTELFLGPWRTPITAPGARGWSWVLAVFGSMADPYHSGIIVYYALPVSCFWVHGGPLSQLEYLVED